MKRFVPHKYQEHCINLILSQPYCGLFLDMGLGKTVITLTAVRALKYYMFAVSRVLVVAPKKVAEATWEDERRQWEHLRDMRISHVLGSRDQRIRALQEKADVYVINRENIPWLVEHYRHGRDWPFDMVVLDESSSFKNHRAKRFKALKVVRPKIRRLVLLTGTPAPHGLEDLWSQIYLLDGGQRLGRTITCYREIYFNPGLRNGMQVFNYVPKPFAREAVFSKISDICISMKADDYLDMPDLIYDDIPVVLDGKAQKAYRQLEHDMLLPVSEEDVVVASSAGVLTGKLLQLCNGAVYATDLDGESAGVKEIHSCKLDALVETIERLQGQHALVFYQFKHDLDRILACLGSMSSLRVRVYTGPQDADAWNDGKVDILLAHPASCGYGLNLQRGGHHIIWFGLTWALEQYQQANARLYRQGQEHPVIIHHLIVKGGMDRDVMAALQDKRSTQDALLDALKARIKEVHADE